MHDEKKDWEFFRKTAREVFWPQVEQEYREELTGIAEGLKARGVQLDIWDVVALNAWLELPYYDKWYDKSTGTGAEQCATCAGPLQRVCGHRQLHERRAARDRAQQLDELLRRASGGTSFSTSRRRAGHRMLMDGMPGLIHSGDDFGVNAAGIAITETTISEFNGFDPNGVPEFVRARKAMQYAGTIDDFARIMKDGNNGGYANNWLVADRKNNEIASLELGLKNVMLQRTKDGFFVGVELPGGSEAG